MPFELRHLRAFVHLAEAKHFGVAAERLGITQPALSQTIKGLEEALGVVLLDRRPRRLTLSAAGEIFLTEAIATIAQADRAERIGKRTGRGQAGLVEIGYVGSAPFSPVFSRIISGFREKFAGLSLRMTQLPSMVQMDRIAQSSLDCGFVRTPLGPPPPGVITRVLDRERLLIALPDTHRLAQATACSLSQFATDPFIQYQPQANAGLHGLVTGLCRSAGFEPLIAQMVPQVATVICLVQAGLGVALVPATMSALAIRGVVYLEIDSPDAVTELRLVARYPEASPSARAFFRHATKREADK
jgi:DNA-binding transcriptional LysR family regulator